LSLWQTFDDEHYVATLRKFVRERIRPEAYRLDRDELYPTELIREMAGQGMNALTLPKEYGGGGANFRRAVALFEELGTGSALVAVSLITIFQAQNLILKFGSPSLRSRYLPHFARGLIASYALTEAAHGSDIRSLDTRARFDGQHWVLTGQKSFITSGTAAELFMILAQTDIGVSVFAVPRSSEGLSTYIGHQSETFGLRNGPHVELVLDNVRVPSDHLIGEEGKGVKLVVTNLNYSRTFNAAVTAGIARVAFEEALAYTKQRKAFGKSVFEFQGIQWYFAEMLADIDSARLLMYRAADALDQGVDIERYASEAKLKCCAVANRVASQAVQVCGAYGTTVKAPFNRYLRDAKTFEIAGGSLEVLKNTISRYLEKIDLDDVYSEPASAEPVSVDARKHGSPRPG
jgi:alkylation response protein AidB-like acyl-CoA dehydrogenase